MLSRVADRIFWMSRQMERAENMARILGVTHNLVLFGTMATRDPNLLRYGVETYAGLGRRRSLWVGLGSWLFADAPPLAVEQLRVASAPVGYLRRIASSSSALAHAAWW